MHAAGPHFDILVVEDEALLVMDLEAMLEDEGHRLVGEADTSVAALAKAIVHAVPVD